MIKITAILSLLAVGSCFSTCSYIETHYTRNAIVTNVNQNLVTAKDENGYLWEFEGEGFEKDTEVKLIMDTNHTDSNIFDDKVIDVR